MFILKVISVWFIAADFSLFSCVSVNLTFTLFYSTVYVIYRTFAVPL